MTPVVTTENYPIFKLELERILLKEKTDEWRQKGMLTKGYKEAMKALKETEEAITILKERIES